MSDRKTLLTALGHNASWVFFAHGLSGLLNLVVLIWFARLLGSEAMGSYAQIVVTIDLVAGVLGFGFNQSLIRTPNDRELRAAAVVATAAQVIAMVATTAVALLFLGGGNNVSSFIVVTVLTLIARCIGLFTYIVDSDFRARLQYRPVAIAQVVGTLFGTAVGVGALYAGAGIGSLALREFSASVLVFLFFLVRYEHKWQLQSSERAYASLWSFTRSLWALNALERVALRLDYVLVGYALGRELLGIYFAVRGIVEGTLGFLLNPIQNVLYSFYCRLSDVRRLISKLNVLALLVVALAGVAATLVYLSPPASLIEVTLGEDYVAGALMIPGLVVYAVSILWFENTKVAAMSVGVHGRIVLARLWQVGVLAAITLPMAYFWGLFGATVATGLGALSLATLAAMTLARVLGSRRTGSMGPSPPIPGAREG